MRSRKDRRPTTRLLAGCTTQPTNPSKERLTCTSYVTPCRGRAERAWCDLCAQGPLWGVRFAGASGCGLWVLQQACLHVAWATFPSPHVRCGTACYGRKGCKRIAWPRVPFLLANTGHQCARGTYLALYRALLRCRTPTTTQGGKSPSTSKSPNQQSLALLDQHVCASGARATSNLTALHVQHLI